METTSTPDRIVIVGGGLAAVHAVETLREEGHDGSLTVVAAESHPPYQRPPLSKSFLKGDKPLDVVYPHDEAWWAEQGVRLLTGRTAASLELGDEAGVRLDDGETLGFDALLLATGATPRVPDLPGARQALYLRTIEDSQRLRRVLEAGGRMVIVGGGWIGLEVAAAARGAGLDVTVLERDPLPLQRILGDRMAQHVADLHARHGVEIRTGVAVSEIRPDAVVTDHGTVPADHVLVAVGAAPSVGLAQQAGLACDNGILVDQRLRSSDPRVLAAGDVANAAHATLGRLRVEHWDNAIRQGRLAARSLLGREVSYDWAPYFYTDQFDFGMEYVGHGSPDDEVVVRGSLEDGEFIAYWLKGTTVTAAMNVNIWDVSDRLRELVGTTVDPDGLTDLR